MDYPYPHYYNDVNVFNPILINMKLVYKSKAFPITIEEYFNDSFIYDQWTISDEYTKVAIGNEYRVVVTSLTDIQDHNNLTCLAIKTSTFIERLTMLLKYVVGISLNSPHKQLTYKCIRGVDFREIPNGWEANIDEIDSFLMETRPSHVSYTIFPTNAYMLSSVLSELQIALNGYNALDEEIKDLMALHNSAVESDERSCFLIMSKVIDIINYLYPLDKSHHKSDKRITTYFPELLPFFTNSTIKDLMGIANGRKETRHYDNKRSGTPHSSLYGLEAEQFYQRVDVLALSIVRKKLGLPPINVQT